ncbi:glycerol channel [Dispira simplex]|nr:glycerol channel [Dispira simplex]
MASKPDPKAVYSSSPAEIDQVDEEDASSPSVYNTARVANVHSPQAAAIPKAQPVQSAEHGYYPPPGIHPQYQDPEAMMEKQEIDEVPSWEKRFPGLGGIFEKAHSLRTRYNDYLAEFAGTLTLVLLGNGVLATVILYPDATETSAWLMISFGWGFALTMALFVSGGISGGHVNPAITFAAACLRGFPWRKVPGYIVMQLLGAFCGAGLLFGLVKSSIDHRDGGERHVLGLKGTGGIFATYPQPWITIGTAFLAEAFATGVLVLFIYAITDERNMPSTRFAPLAIGLALTSISMSLGFQTGFAVNPARDLGPRVFTVCAGYSSSPFHAFTKYAWVPVVAPFVGAIIGGLVYDFFINHPRLEIRDDHHHS